jgi:hypothetical protein
MSDLRNRHETPEPDWLLPITPPDGVGIVTPGCRDRSDALAIPVRVGVGLRIGGEADLCLRCGPDGSVYHPAGRTMAEVRAVAARLPFAPGYDPAEITPADLAAFDARMRRALGLDPDLPPLA